MTKDAERAVRVCVTSNVNFGRPSVNGISTNVLAQRFIDGESISALAADYQKLGHGDIEEALRFEMRFMERLDWASDP